MAIFGRSKKKPPKAQSPPERPSPLFAQPPTDHVLLNAKASKSTWGLVKQRPNHSQLEILSPPLPNDSSPLHYQDYQPGFPSQVQFAPPSPPLSQRVEDFEEPKQRNMKKLKSMKSLGNVFAGELNSLIPGAHVLNDGIPIGTQYLNQGAALYDLISSKLDAVVTLIDGERFSGDDRELVVFAPQPPVWQQQQQQEPEQMIRELPRGGKSKGATNNAISSALVSTNYFAKVNLYANSRLPSNLPPMKLYVPTYTILCLAAQYSERVYTKPAGKERETHVNADWRMGTKAMVIKSVPVDDRDLIVFAIRGTQTFLDWAVNLNSAPAAPTNFLDDPGNLCHAGFLTVAKKMVKPVAARLRHLLEEDPGRAKCSLLITGHSAGGAVAALLYSHMLSQTQDAESELSILANCFKRIHCVSFGAPPVSLLPLMKPNQPHLKKSIFLSFVNEGDPVARADKAYVRSLLDLYSTPAPGQSCMQAMTPMKLQPLVQKSKSSLALNKMRPSPKPSTSAPAYTQPPMWPVPEATLSNAGRIVLLRSVERYESRPQRKKHIQERMNEGVVAQMITDELLRGVVWGDPVCHMMKLYSRRIEVLATNAIMGRT
ncbi:lipase class 3 [Phlyctema vagabunda]|uniref:Lipase class 3 n=1 Tax=Phlyctema vagabunda TaxID=108571 RepID=A0ABR4P7E3_9HELO